VFYRKILAGSIQRNASFNIDMLLFRNENLSTAIQAYDDVIVPDVIYVVVELEIDPSNTRLYVQVMRFKRYTLQHD